MLRQLVDGSLYIPDSFRSNTKFLPLKGAGTAELKWSKVARSGNRSTVSIRVR